MTQTMTYSLQTMKGCTGKLQSDGDYFRWFLPETTSRLSLSAAALRGMVAGEAAFTSESPGEAIALLADVRRHAYILKECATWFSGKSSIAEEFTAKLNGLKREIDGAESAHATLREWFK